MLRRIFFCKGITYQRSMLSFAKPPFDKTDAHVPLLAGQRLEIEFRDGKVTLNKGEMYVIPKGVEHKPFAKGLCQVLLVEPKGVINTGGTGGELTAENDIWV